MAGGRTVGPLRVVLLHALPFDGRMWEGQLSWLPTTALAPNLYPLGASIEEWSSSVLAAVGNDPLVAVGASVGGFAALELARQAPEQVEAVVLVGSKAGIRRDEAARDTAVRALQRDGLEGCWDRHWGSAFGPGVDQSVVRRARQQAAEIPLPQLIGGVRAFHDRNDMTEFARTWPGRIHAISGEHDRHPPAAASASVAAHARHGHFRLVEDCGHYVSLERPAVFDAYLREVLADALD